jgi:hypothetical protein
LKRNKDVAAEKLYEVLPSFKTDEAAAFAGLLKLTINNRYYPITRIFTSQVVLPLSAMIEESPGSTG